MTVSPGLILACTSSKSRATPVQYSGNAGQFILQFRTKPRCWLTVKAEWRIQACLVPKANSYGTVHVRTLAFLHIGASAILPQFPQIKRNPNYTAVTAPWSIVNLVYIYRNHLFRVSRKISSISVYNASSILLTARQTRTQRQAVKCHITSSSVVVKMEKLKPNNKK